MLVLAAIRDHVRVEDEAAADRIHRQFLVNEFRHGEEYLRLLPTQADRDSYRALILRSPGGSAAGAVTDAYRFFRTSLVAADDPDDPDDVGRIEEVVKSGLSIVEITADRGDNVYRIFESLNNTGLKLSQADLLRNYLFMRLPVRGEDVHRDIWLPMQERLSSSELELLVWLDLVIRGDERVKQSEIYGLSRSAWRPFRRRTRHRSSVRSSNWPGEPGIWSGSFIRPANQISRCVPRWSGCGPGVPKLRIRLSCTCWTWPTGR